MFSPNIAFTVYVIIVGLSPVLFNSRYGERWAVDVGSKERKQTEEKESKKVSFFNQKCGLFAFLTLT